MSTIIPFPTRPDAPVTVLPTPAVRAGMESAREDDKRQQERVKELARAARRVFDEARSDLKLGIAHEILGLVHALEGLSQRAQACGLVSTAVALNEHAGLLERESALVEAEARP